MESRYCRLNEARLRYGGSEAAWRRWISNGLLGNAVRRLGRLVVIDTIELDRRLAKTGQLLLINSQRGVPERHKHMPGKD